MFQQGDFQITPNTTPQEVAKRRAMIMRMLPQFGRANYTGEGLAHMLSGLMGGQKLRKLDKGEAAQRKRATGIFADMGIKESFDPWMTAQQIKAIKEAKK